ncbi:MAG: cobyrinate a,c-diamide synthase [Dissulfurimicrobium sp.]|uniref:cobyrinate a,c-diamide synthase n=1 Tax=Dissulfurimicrobium sp. TaxID=2022436 RepID=UPI003D0BF81A
MKTFLIAGTQSGVGKTTVALGIMAALKSKGLDVQPFKCGPDFIDPTLHHMVTGRMSRNLDIWMCGEDFVKETFFDHAKGADIAVVEGVMGLFDGGVSSSASLARCLGLPVILVIDVRSMAETVAAIIKGFEVFDPGLVQGVILNRVGSQRHLDLLKDAIKRHCNSDLFLGYLPRDLNFEIPSRHLGLFMANDAPLDKKAVERLSCAVSDFIDLERLMDLQIKPVKIKEPLNLDCTISETGGDGPKNNNDGYTQGHEITIGIARDEAFCFYYEDNLDLFRKMGARITEFSPLSDTAIPDGIDAIYLGGGYPELYAERLSENHEMLNSIRDWSIRGGVVYAECGGFMYLTQGIEGLDQKFYPMVGIYPVRAKMNYRLSALGYREIEPVSGPFAAMYKEGLRTAFAQHGIPRLKGHEFHYSTIEEMPPEVDRTFRLADGRFSGYLIKNTLGSYIHIHFGNTPWAVRRFIEFSKGAGGHGI